MALNEDERVEVILLLGDSNQRAVPKVWYCLWFRMYGTYCIDCVLAEAQLIGKLYELNIPVHTACLNVQRLLIRLITISYRR